MQDHSTFTMGSRFGRELSAGAGGYANLTAEMLELSLMPSWDTNIYRGKGRRYVSETSQTDEHSEGSYTAPLTFTSPLFALLSYVKNVAPVAGPNGSQVWTIIPNPRGGDPIQTFVVETTDEDLVIQNKHAYATSMNIESGRDEATVSGDLYAKRIDVIPNFTPLAGPFAPVWDEATVYPLGSVVQRTSLAGNFMFRATSISGTGTSGATEPTWPGVLGGTVTDNAGANQIIWTAIQNTSEMENVIVSPKDSDIFFNLESMAGLDSDPEQLFRSFSYGLGLGGGRGAFADINSAVNGFTGTTENEVDATLDIDVGLDANDAKTDFRMPFNLALARQNKRMWVRWQNIGPLIGGSTYYMMQIDACVKLRANHDFKDVQGLFGAGTPLQIVNDPIAGYPWKMKLVNKTKVTLLTA